MSRNKQQDDFVLNILVLCTVIVAIWGCYTVFWEVKG